MLKINPEKDIKELEKFGFFLKIKNERMLYVWQNEYDVDCIQVNLETREIRSLGDRNGTIILYDLIKADMVVKE